MPLHLLGISRSGDIAGLPVHWPNGQPTILRHQPAEAIAEPRGGEIRWVAHGRLAAATVRPLPTALGPLAHATSLATIHAHISILPVRYGTVLPDEEAVRHFLGKRRDEPARRPGPPARKRRNRPADRASPQPPANGTTCGKRSKSLGDFTRWILGCPAGAIPVARPTGHSSPACRGDLRPSGQRPLSELAKAVAGTIGHRASSIPCRPKAVGSVRRACGDVQDHEDRPTVRTCWSLASLQLRRSDDEGLSPTKHFPAPPTILVGTRLAPTIRVARRSQ